MIDIEWKARLWGVQHPAIAGNEIRQKGDGDGQREYGANENERRECQASNEREANGQRSRPFSTDMKTKKRKLGLR